MSNQRRPAPGNQYRTGFLTSRAWFARRDRWFRDHTTTGQPLTCQGCGDEETPRHLELHHLTYDGVTQAPDGRWAAWERHGDLLPLHPACHEELHRLIDRDVVLSRHRTREDATWIALDALRPTLQTGTTHA